MNHLVKRVMASVLALAILLAVAPTIAFSAQTERWTRSPEGYYVNSKGEEIVGALRRGIDVSEFNGTIDWEKAKADDVGFAIIRVGGRYMTGRNFYYDSQFERNVAECERLGIPYGVYFFSTAKTAAEGREEALFTLNHLKNINPTMPIYIDMEWEAIGSTSNRQMLANVATAFCETIAAYGLEPGVYANTNWFTNYLTDPCFDRWTRWVAQYYSVCQYEGVYDMWQCTSTATIDGISGNVDVNMDFRPNWGMTGEWVQEGGGWKYRFADGSHASGDLIYISGLVYSFDANNFARTGWQKINGAWHYFDPTTYAMQRGWLKQNDIWYWLDLNTGKAATGWQKVNGTWYCFRSDCSLITNDWAFDGDNRYYMDKNGHALTRRWFSPDGNITWYYFGSDGIAYADQWFDYNGFRYRFGSDCALLVSSWAKVDGYWYYLDDLGHLVQSSFVTTGNRLYYVDEDARLVTGWRELANGDGTTAWYYFDPSGGGAAHTDRWLKYNNAWYYFGSDSKLLLDSWVKYGDAWYCLGADGKLLMSSWVRYEDGSWYYLGADGRMVTDTWVKGGSVWYYLGSNGKLVVSDWVSYKGTWYYMDENGKMLVNTSIDLDGVRYFFDGNGRCYRKENLVVALSMAAPTESVTFAAEDALVEADTPEE